MPDKDTENLKVPPADKKASTAMLLQLEDPYAGETIRQRQYRLTKQNLEKSWSKKDGEPTTYMQTKQAMEDLINRAASDSKLLKMIVDEANSRGMGISSSASTAPSEQPYGAASPHILSSNRKNRLPTPNKMRMSQEQKRFSISNFKVGK